MKKNLKLTLLGMLCCFSLFFMTPECTLLADAAAGGGSDTIQPRAEIVEWVYAVMDKKLYKRLYNHTTDKYISDWIYVRDLTQEEIDALNP